tara:strand:- start:1494 stop:2645 length:1152 start_codon:yes stop_codon:yes gene_type:complete
MELKVKAVDGNAQKSQAEIEEKLLKEHEVQEQQVVENKVDLTSNETESEPINSVEPVEAVETTENSTPASELNDDEVLSYIKNRYDKDINSVEELFETKESNEVLPEDVKKYFDYKKDTGRGIEDFVKLQKNYDDMDEDDVLADYLNAQEEGLDAIDIQDIMEDKFGYDEEVDEVKDIKKRKLAKKRELAKAKKFFSEQKDKYKIPLESSRDGISEEQQKDLTAYKEYVEKSNTLKSRQDEAHDYFTKRTDEIFNDDFKGFEFSVSDDKKINYKPGTKEELKNKQSNLNNWLSTFIDEDKGLIKDAKGYHKAVSVAMNPEKFAKFFYEQGVAATVDDVAKKSKNINMDVRRTPQLNTKNSIKIRPVGDTSSGRGLKIKSIKKV